MFVYKNCSGHYIFEKPSWEQCPLQFSQYQHKIQQSETTKVQLQEQSKDEISETTVRNLYCLCRYINDSLQL